MTREFVSGSFGLFFINDYNFPAAVWSAEWSGNGIPMGSNASLPYFSILPGMKTCVVSAYGVYDTNFNPFTDGHNAFLGANVNMYLQIDEETYTEGTIAYIDKWRWKVDSNGLATWSMVALADWKFHDFGGSDA